MCACNAYLWQQCEDAYLSRVYDVSDGVDADTVMVRLHSAVLHKVVVGYLPLHVVLGDETVAVLL